MNRSPEAQAQYERLLPEAIAAAGAAWCPHSNFPVGAALLGLSAGQSIEWAARDGRVRRLQVIAVHAGVPDTARAS